MKQLKAFFPRIKKYRNKKRNISNVLPKVNVQINLPGNLLIIHLITRARFKAQLYCWLHTDVRFKRVSVPDILLGCVK